MTPWLINEQIEDDNFSVHRLLFSLAWFYLPSWTFWENGTEGFSSLRFYMWSSECGSMTREKKAISSEKRGYSRSWRISLCWTGWSQLGPLSGRALHNGEGRSRSQMHSAAAVTENTSREVDEETWSIINAEIEAKHIFQKYGSTKIDLHDQASSILIEKK